jgi:hypothetical protein
VEEPELGTPPEGFDTWAEYLTYKCQAAHVIWSLLRSLAVANSALAGLQVTAALAAPVLAGLLGAWPVALTPPGFVALVAGVTAIGVIDAFAFLAFIQWVAWWDTHQNDIVCSLYQSGSAAAAITAINDAVEDGIQAIEWTGLLAGLSGAVAPAMGVVISGVVDNSFVTPLFRLVAAVSFPGASCDCSDPDVRGWHFTQDEEGWVFSSNTGGGHITWTPTWDPSPPTPDPYDIDHPCLKIAGVSDNPGASSSGWAQWKYTWATGHGPVAKAGARFWGDFIMSAADHTAQYDIVYEDSTYEDADPMTRSAGTWHSESHYASSDKYGKRVKSFGCKTSWGSATTASFTVRFDRILADAWD